MLFAIDNLTVHNGRGFTLGPINLGFGAGVHGLLGPNGAGKSTLLSTIATLRKPKTGKIRLGNSGTVRDIRESLGLLPQDNLPRSRMTVRDHLRYLSWLKKVPDLDAATAEAADIAGIGDFLDRKLRQLSGGERRRVGIASALINHPSLIILDEPSVGLDISQRTLISETLDKMRSTSAILFSTHIVEDVVGHCDTITVLNRGAVRWHGAAPDFAENSTAAYRDRYLELVRA